MQIVAIKKPLSFHLEFLWGLWAIIIAFYILIHLLYAQFSIQVQIHWPEVLFENAPKDPVLLDNRVNLVESERLIAIKVKNFESLVAVIVSQPWSWLAQGVPLSPADGLGLGIMIERPLLLCLKVVLLVELEFITVDLAILIVIAKLHLVRNILLVSNKFFSQCLLPLVYFS